MRPARAANEVIAEAMTHLPLHLLAVGAAAILHHAVMPMPLAVLETPVLANEQARYHLKSRQ